MKISIIIPLYNKEAHIRRTLDSVFGQSFKDFEVVVVDDGSTDNSAEIVEKYSDLRLRLIKQSNRGVSCARNRGVKEASGAYIAFLDADDSWEPCFLETISNLIDKFPEAGAYVTAFRFIEPNGCIRAQKYKGIFPPPWEGIVPNYFKSLVHGSTIINSSNVCIPKKVFNFVGLFVEDEKYGEDTAMWGRIALSYPIAFSHQIGATYHQNATNRACGSHRQSRDWSFIAVANQAIKTIDDHEIKRYLREFLDKSLMRMAADNICINNCVFARNLMHKIQGSAYVWKKAAWIVLSYLPFPVTKLIVKAASRQ